MAYYSDAQLERIRDIVEAEIRSGVHLLSASYLARRHRLDAVQVQRVLSDLETVGDLEVHYRLQCSGEGQMYDVDREVKDKSEIPTQAIVCTKCGERKVAPVSLLALAHLVRLVGRQSHTGIADGDQ
jgi:hypothetical protein